MKKLFFFLSILFASKCITAQSVGIGTNTPNTSAQLDVSSTSKGLLIPRMTTAQRTAIAAPANGLMVYDTDFNEYHYFDGGTWRKFLNSNYDYWNKSATRNWVYNSTDSIGIGTSSPDEKFQLPNDFLMQMMEINETLAEKDGVTLAAEMAEIEKELYNEIIPLLQQPPGNITEEGMHKLKEYYYKKKYLSRILARLGD